MSIKTEAEKHAVISVLLVAIACFGGAWAAYDAFFGKRAEQQIADRDREISKHKEEISRLNSKVQELQECCPARSAQILEPTWVNKGATVTVIDEQVLIRVYGVYPALGSVTVDVDIPDQGVNHWDISLGSRKIFKYKDNNYFIVLHEADSDRAKIAVTKQL